MREIRTDVLIVGGGGGAVRAAIEAKKEPVSVLIVTKGELGKSGATAYQVSEMAGFNVPDGVKDKRDSPENYYNDMMAAAQGMADPKLVQIIAEGAIDAGTQLKKWGVYYKQEDGRDYAFLSCFSNYARTHVIPGHGEPILAALLNHLPKDVQCMENSMILQLLVKDGRCIGAYGLCQGEETIILAKTVVLGTGGAGQLFEKNMNPKDITGDGYALGYLAGAQLMNMEFMQVGIGISYPQTLLLNAYLWGGYPEIKDTIGQSIFKAIGADKKMVMDAHQYHFPFSSRDDSKYFEIGIQKAIKEGRGTVNQGVICDMTMMNDEYVKTCTNQFGLHEMWPEVKAFFTSKKVDILEEQVEIACFAHAVNGGIRIDETGRSTVEGLYALGETAGGTHGADRLGGNMMVTCQIYGKLVGREAAKKAGKGKFWDGGQTELGNEIEKTRKILHSQIPVQEMKEKIQSLNHRYQLVLRNESGLKYLEDQIIEMEESLVQWPVREEACAENVELYHMLTTSRLMVKASMHRKESRGSHYREDYTEKREEYGKPFILKNEE